MVNELNELMRENVAAPPPDHLDIDAVMLAGRRRARGRRAAIGGTVVLVAGLVTGTALVLPGGFDGAGPADDPPTPDASTLTLADAEPAVEGRDYLVLASYTNDNLDRDNGQYFDGVTDDGLVLFRDGPRADQLWPRMALMDPATGEKAWLPYLDVGQQQLWPVELGADRLVLVGLDDFDGGMRARLVAHVYDRATSQWSTVTWPQLPKVEFPIADLGPDGRLYVSVPATKGKPPEGGWPMGPEGEADDADAEGDTYHLWSVSLGEGSDVRDEGLDIGDLAFTDTAMVWTDRTNGDAGRVHVRELASGNEHSFDPHAGERCNLLSFGATDDRVVLGQYCGTYDDGVRDDRVQIVTTDGDQVVTLQDDGISAGLYGGNGVVTVTSYQRSEGGTYVYELDTGRFLRVSDSVSGFGLGGPAPDGEFIWHTPVNNRRGATQWLGELLP
jgi:hypothetical protein